VPVTYTADSDVALLHILGFLSTKPPSSATLHTAAGVQPTPHEHSRTALTLPDNYRLSLPPLVSAVQ
jgi:hypothetical protein